MIRKHAIPVVTASALIILHVASAHPGRTDANGGHYNRKTGTYHYHGSSASRVPSAPARPQPAPLNPVLPKTPLPAPIVKAPVEAPKVPAANREIKWIVLFNEKVAHGTIGVSTDSGHVVEVLTDAHAIEAERVSNYPAGLVGARLSGKAADKTARGMEKNCTQSPSGNAKRATSRFG